jgi:hypothetical protein
LKALSVKASLFFTKKKMNRYILVLIAIASFACSEIKAPKSLSAYTFESLEIPVAENFAPRITRNQYMDTDSGEYLAIFNKTSPRLEIFNLDTKKSAKSIYIQSEGPNGVRSFNGFTIIAKDCLLLAAIPPKLQILDFEGNKKRSIPINDPENKVNWLGSTNVLPFLFKDSILFGSQPFFTDIYQTTENEAKISKPFYNVNLASENSNVYWLQIRRPEDEWKNGKISPNLAWADRYDSIIISPISDHRLWIISKKEEKLLGYKEVKSSLIKNFRTLKDYPVGDKEIIIGLEAGRYELIQYDKYRDIFYRFFFAPINLENYTFTASDLYVNKPKIGILLLDKNLDIIGEHVFPDHTVENWNYFVGRKGLYVSTNNPNRDDFDENYLRYDIIRFEGLEYDE